MVVKHVTVQDRLSLSESFIETIEVIKSPTGAYKSFIAGKTVDSDLFHIFVENNGDVKTTVSFKKSSLALDRKKLLTMNEYHPIAEYVQSLPGEFMFYFGDPFKENAPEKMKVRLGYGDVHFPELFTQKQIDGLNSEGKMKILKAGPTMREVAEAWLKLNKVDIDAFFFGKKYGFEFIEWLQARHNLLEIVDFRKEIDRAASIAIDVDRMLENEKIKNMIAQVAKENELRKIQRDQEKGAVRERVWIIGGPNASRP